MSPSLAKISGNITPKPSKLVKIEIGFLSKITTSEVVSSDACFRRRSFVHLRFDFTSPS